MASTTNKDALPIYDIRTSMSRSRTSWIVLSGRCKAYHPTSGLHTVEGEFRNGSRPCCWVGMYLIRIKLLHGLLCSCHKLKRSRLAIDIRRCEPPHRPMLPRKHPVEDSHHPCRHTREVVDPSFKTRIHGTQSKRQDAVLSVV
jgi:hypothetical protein